MKINGIPLHDLHLHTGLSMCSRDKGATPETYAPIAAKNGVELIGISDHIWDIRIKLPMDINFTSNCFEHQLQHFNDCAEALFSSEALAYARCNENLYFWYCPDFSASPVVFECPKLFAAFSKDSDSGLCPRDVEIVRNLNTHTPCYLERMGITANNILKVYSENIKKTTA